MRIAAIITSILLFVATACDDDAKIASKEVTFKIVYPDEIAGAAVYDETIEIVDRSFGVRYTFDRTDNVELAEGYYECTYSASVTLEDGKEYELVGYNSSVKVTQDQEIELKAYLTKDADDFVIEEVFYTGTVYSSGKTYVGDQYLKIYNNTDHTLYADGLAIFESKFKSVSKYEYTPDIMSTHFATDAVYVVPGDGDDHPIEAGESILICDVGIDHRNINPNSFDLSGADFEWYDVSSSASNQDIDSPTVENLDKWCCYTNSIWVLHKSGYCTYAIGRMQVDLDTFVKEYVYDYTYQIVTTAGTFDMSGVNTWKIPNEWIIDAVTLSVSDVYQWNVIDASIDRGYAQCGDYDKDANRYFKSVRRKMLYVTSDGRRVLKDTNNSTDDFNRSCIASVIEEQGTPINEDGTCADVVTYDGVTPKEQ